MRRWAPTAQVMVTLLLLLGVGLLSGCGILGNQAGSSTTFQPDPTQPTSPTDLPAHIPIMPNAQFQAQSISITLPIGLSTATTPQTWIWTILASQASIISFYRAQLPQMGWSHLTFEANGDGPALSVCGTSPQNTSEILEVEAANTISGTDIADVNQTYTAPTNGAVFVIGIIPTTSCASVI